MHDVLFIIIITRELINWFFKVARSSTSVSSLEAELLQVKEQHRRDVIAKQTALHDVEKLKMDLQANQVCICE